MTKDRMRSIAAYAAADTKRVYRFEEESTSLNGFRRRCSFDTLYKEARKVWKDIFFHYRYEDFPEFRFGKGTKHGNKFVSYYDTGKHLIELSPNGRNLADMTHELVHASGAWYHNSEFVMREFHVFSEYFDVDLKLLSYEAEKFDLPYQLYLH